MPDFATANNSRSFGIKLSEDELVRAIRFSIAAEYEAIQIYQQILESTDTTQAKAVLSDIIKEERLHAGQFLDLLYKLAPDEKALYDQGAQENAKLTSCPPSPF